MSEKYEWEDGDVLIEYEGEGELEELNLEELPGAVDAWVRSASDAAEMPPSGTNR